MRRSVIAFGVLILLGVCGLGAVGCATSPKSQHVSAGKPRPAEAELRAWREAVHAFQRGDYEKATALFEILNESAEDAAMSRKGLFGMAVTRLLLAKTQAEFADAMVLLECWKEQAPQEMTSEDPLMLIPLLERFPQFSAAETVRPKADKTERDFVTSNLTACKNTLQLREKDIERLKSRLDSRDREIRKLRGQIESLEAIHRKFQERKQEVSSQ